MRKLFSYLDESFDVEILKKMVLLIFVMVPVLTSLVSTYHTYHLFTLGNMVVVSLVIALTYELINLAALGMIVLYSEKVNPSYLWTVFIFMTIIQIIGNVYYSYDYVIDNLARDSEYLDNFISFVNRFINVPNSYNNVLILSMFIGVPIPLLSSILVHMSAEYLKKEIEVKEKEELYNKSRQAEIDDLIAKLEELKSDNEVLLNDNKSLATELSTADISEDNILELINKYLDDIYKDENNKLRIYPNHHVSK